MNRDPMESLSAFVDGEAVEPADLSDALAHPRALDALVDFIRLRTALREDRSETSPRFGKAMETLLAKEPTSPPGRRRAVGLGIAASLLVGLGLAAGWAMRSGSGAQTPPRPPEATRELHFREGIDWWSRS